MQASRRASREALGHAAVGGIPSPSPTSTYVFLQVFCFFPFSFLTLSMLFIASFSLRGDEGTLTVAFNQPVAAAPAAAAARGVAAAGPPGPPGLGQYTGLYTFVDEPARFGPRITDAGVRGQLFLSEPLDACGPIKSAYEIAGKNSTSIVLIQRGDHGAVAGGGNASDAGAGACTFYDKVMRAQDAGYAAAIVFDDEYEGLVVMSMDPSAPRLPEPGIPSVFISMDDGNVIASLLVPRAHGQYAGDYYAILSSGSINEQLWGNMLASMFMAALCLSIILASIIVIRRRRSLNQFYIRLALDALQEQNEEGAAGGAGGANAVMRQEDLDAIPVVTFDSAQAPKAGGGAAGGDAEGGAPDCGTSRSFDNSNATWETCTICLDEYEDGEELRELPCGHAFHRECIDLWLTTKASFCPMCKADCSAAAAAGASGRAATEQTPLLTDEAGARRAGGAEEEGPYSAAGGEGEGEGEGGGEADEEADEEGFV